MASALYSWILLRQISLIHAVVSSAALGFLAPSYDSESFVESCHASSHSSVQRSRMPQDFASSYSEKKSELLHRTMQGTVISRRWIRETGGMWQSVACR